MNALRTLYYETHIIPSEQDFLRRANNGDWMYMALYWLKKEHLYEQFVEEEMDFETMTIMNEHDIRYFGLSDCVPFYQWLIAIQSPR
jgi:hypothetical protein